MPYDTIRLAREGDVAVLTMHRPERLNAITPAMADEMLDALERLDGARALLLTGEGRAFCSGADLAARAAETRPPGEAGYAALTEHYNPLVLKLARLDVPVVAAVNGAAAGIGCSLALTADFVLMGEGAFLLEAFVRIALAGDGGAAWALTRLVGKARAAQMLMLGERVPGRTAEAWGLAHRCIPDGELMAEAGALAARLAAGPTRALGLIRRSLAEASSLDLQTALQREAEVRLSLGDSPDTHEGGLAFAEKRPPAFVGR